MDNQIKRETRSKFVHQTINDVLFGVQTITGAAIKLGYNQNYIYELLRKFEPDNDLCYVSKKVGVPINVKTNDDIIKFICDEFRLACKRMQEKSIIVVGRPTRWFTTPTYNLFYDLIKDKIPFKKSRMIEILKENNLFSSRTRGTVCDNKSISIQEARERKSGQEVQLDGKVNIQFPDDEFTCVAHLAVDAGTNTILGITFDQQETNEAYIELLRIVFTNYGVPNIIVTDCRSSFTTNKVIGDKNVVIAQGLKDLSELVTSSNVKRKNKVESKNDVFQMRILSMLNMMGIRTMEQAKGCILNIIDQVNTDPGNNISDENYFTPFPKELDFDMIFATKVERKAHKYSQFQFENKYYFALKNNSEILYLKNKVSIDVFKRPDGQVNIKYKGSFYQAIEATCANKNKYEYKYETTKTVVYKSDRYDLFINDKWYHLVDNTNTIFKINEGDSVTKVFDKANNLKFVLVNKHRYTHVEGRAPISSDIIHHEIDYAQSKVKYDSSIKLQGRSYYVIHEAKQVVLPAGTEVNVVIENGIPSHIEHKKMMLSLYDINLIDISLYIPKSHHTAKILFEKPSTDVIKIY